MVLIWWYITDFFNFIYELLSSVISWILSIITLITSCIGFLIKVVGVLPTSFTISFVALIAIAVIYKIFGREAGN